MQVQAVAAAVAAGVEPEGPEVAAGRQGARAYELAGADAPQVSVAGYVEHVRDTWNTCVPSLISTVLADDVVVSGLGGKATSRQSSGQLVTLGTQPMGQLGFRPGPSMAWHGPVRAVPRAMCVGPAWYEIGLAIRAIKTQLINKYLEPKLIINNYFIIVKF